MKEKVEQAVANAISNVECETKEVPFKTALEIQNYLIQGEKKSAIYHLYKLAVEEDAKINVKEEGHGRKK